MKVNCWSECQLLVWKSTAGMSVNSCYESELLVWMSTAGVKVKFSYECEMFQSCFTTHECRLVVLSNNSKQGLQWLYSNPGSHKVHHWWHIYLVAGHTYRQTDIHTEWTLNFSPPLTLWQKEMQSNNGPGHRNKQSVWQSNEKTGRQMHSSMP